MDFERQPTHHMLHTLQRALAGRVAVVGEAHDLADAGLTDLPTGWQSLAPTPDCWDAMGAAAGSCVWVVRAGRFDGDRWTRTLNAFAASSATALTLVVLDVPGSGASLRRALENLAFATGLRKHAGYYLMLDYEALQRDGGPLVVPLEKMPPAALESYPLQALKDERDLHMDMLREAGERSDGHVIRYHLAAELVRPGDRVLDAACGLGYGSYVLAQASRCASVVGVDGSDYAIAYAQQNFGVADPRLAFRHGWLPDDLADLPDESFDLIISFETLEHIENPTGLLAEFHRLLRPGGRIVVSVPNDWSDETGKDPNPHHLHVYTLDTLRQQFSRHFVRERLHQQIASGCKRRSTGNRWAPLPRTLREVPVDTDMAPDSEWWIMSGSKPPRQAVIDYGAPGYAALQPPWAESAAGPDALAQGLVLAMHCVPADVDPAVEAFWSHLGQELARRGHALVLLSTAPVSDPALQVIEMPFELTDFVRRHATVPSAGVEVGEQTLHDAVAWYGCDHDEARDNLRLAQAFLRDLLDTLRPAAVLGWQALNPLTRLLRDAARTAELPWWTAERGWVRNTLMFDLGGAHLLGELDTSLSSARARARYQASPGVLQALQQRATQATSLARYAGAERLGRAALREKLGIPLDAPVAVLFTHGEPGMNSMGTAAVREMHDLSPALLQQRVDALGQALSARGHWLLVQEHPFNAVAGRSLRLPDGARVLSVREDVSSLLDAADTCLFTLATLQFDAVFFDKPLGLLSRSALYRDGEPPCMGDFESADAFLDAVLDMAAWPERFERLRSRVAFLYEQLLIDVEPGVVESGAAEWAEHLARLRRPVDTGFERRVERFLQRWGSAAVAADTHQPPPPAGPELPATVLGELQVHLRSLGLPCEGLHFESDGGACVHRADDLCVIADHDGHLPELKQRYEALCNIDVDGQHLWVGVPSVTEVLAPHASPVIVSFYTKGTPYEAQARGLIESIERLGDVPYCIVGIDSAGSWEANCSLKPGFILQCLNELQRPVLWVDADARLLSRPAIPSAFDFAIHRHDGWEFASGTVYFGCNERARQLLESWIDLCRERPLIWDQMLLDQAWAGHVREHALVTGWLPESYTHIFDSAVAGAGREAPVISHYQASRSVVDKRPKPPVPAEVAGSRRQAGAWYHAYDVPSQRVLSSGGLMHDVWPGVNTDFGRLMDYLNALRGEAGERVSFLQVGAMDGVKFDPLHKRIRSQGWRGVLFEPLPDMFEKLRHNCADCEGLTLVQAAIDVAEGTREMYRIPLSAVASGQLPEWALGISSFYKDRNALGGKKIDAATHAMVEAHTVREEVPCTTFDRVLTEHRIETLDLLQIDTEGHDWAILQTFPIDRLRPAVINFEYYNLQPSEVRAALAWLREHGYAYGMDHKDVTATRLRLP